VGCIFGLETGDIEMTKNKSEKVESPIPARELDLTQEFVKALAPHTDNVRPLRKEREDKDLIIQIEERAEPRVREAIERRTELMRMYTREMPGDYLEQLIEADRIIAAAVTVSVRSGAHPVR
jgi:hypothetical protein